MSDSQKAILNQSSENRHSQPLLCVLAVKNSKWESNPEMACIILGLKEGKKSVLNIGCSESAAIIPSPGKCASGQQFLSRS